MAKNIQTSKQTIQLIVDILSFEISDDDLKLYLADTTIDWNQIVTVASEHFVLPAVYCRLKQKSLLDLLPNDLVLYLEELTQLNRERNQTLLNEVEHISNLFNSNSIEYVLVKGTALLVGNYYKDIGERMIGDIDILVATKDLDRAFSLLVSIGYDQFVSFNYEVKNYRHRPRQISDKKLGAVELHDQLLKHKYNHLIDKNMVLSRTDTVRDIAIPVFEMLIWNSILAQQINDRGYYYNTITIKVIYDLFVLGLSQEKLMLKKLSNNKYSLKFLTLASIFVPEMAPSKQGINNRLRKQTFLLYLDNYSLGRQIMELKALYIGMYARLQLLFFNKSYREHILKNKLNK